MFRSGQTRAIQNYRKRVADAARVARGENLLVQRGGWVELVVDVVRAFDDVEKNFGSYRAYYLRRIFLGMRWVLTTLALLALGYLFWQVLVEAWKVVHAAHHDVRISGGRESALFYMLAGALLGPILTGLSVMGIVFIYRALTGEAVRFLPRAIWPLLLPTVLLSLALVLSANVVPVAEKAAAFYSYAGSVVASARPDSIITEQDPADSIGEAGNLLRVLEGRSEHAKEFVDDVENSESGPAD